MSDSTSKAPSSASGGAQQASSSGVRSPFALRFVSGKYQGGEFPVPPNKEIVIGRSSELEMVLVEDMVSRRHARIFWEGDHMQIEDLGSTNGTFVNGERLKRAQLKEGDRLLIGTSILRVIAPESIQALDESKRDLESVAAQRRTSQVRTMAGTIDEIPLPDLLQLLSSSKKTGVLVIRTEDDMGRIYLRKGQLYFAIINDLDEVPPLKSLFRLLTWQKGVFDFDPTNTATFANEIDVGVPELLMEGLRQLDEFAALKDNLPDLRAEVTLASPLLPPLRELGPAELDVLQLAHNYKSFESVLNKSLALDLETAQIVMKLLKAKYLAVK